MPLVLCVVEGRAQSILLTGTAVAVDTNNNGDRGKFFAGVGWRIGTRTLVKVLGVINPLLFNPNPMHSLFTYPSTYPFNYPSTYPSTYPFTYTPCHTRIRHLYSTYPSTYPPIPLRIAPPIPLTIPPPIPPPIPGLYLSLYLSSPSHPRPF